MRSPGFTRVPISIGMVTTCPDAVFDFTSMTLMGSMMPVAVTETLMSRRMTAAVWIMTGLAAVLLQPAATTRSATKRILRFTANSGWRLFGRWGDGALSPGGGGAGGAGWLVGAGGGGGRR